MRRSNKFVWAILLSLGLLIFGPSMARAVAISDVLQVTWDSVTETRTIIERPGEAVTEEIDFTFTTGTSDFDQNNFTSDFVYLVEPNQPFTINANGTVTGFRSDDIQFKVSHESGAATTTVTFTINSDEDPGTHDTVTGFLETGQFQDITTALLGNSLVGSGHTATVLVASDVEVAAKVPEPATMILLGSGLLGLWGARKKFKK